VESVWPVFRRRLCEKGLTVAPSELRLACLRRRGKVCTWFYTLEVAPMDVRHLLRSPRRARLPLSGSSSSLPADNHPGQASIRAQRLSAPTAWYLDLSTASPSASSSRFPDKRFPPPTGISQYTVTNNTGKEVEFLPTSNRHPGRQDLPRATTTSRCPVSTPSRKLRQRPLVSAAQITAPCTRAKTKPRTASQSGRTASTHGPLHCLRRRPQ